MSLIRGAVGCSAVCDCSIFVEISGRLISFVDFSLKIRIRKKIHGPLALILSSAVGCHVYTPGYFHQPSGAMYTPLAFIFSLLK